MLTGKQLFTGESSNELLAAVMKQEPNLNAVPIEIRHVVSRCLRKNPHERWQSVGDVWIALEEAEQAAGASTPRASRSAYRSLGFSLAALLLAALSLAGFWLWRRQASLPPSAHVPVTSGGYATAPSFSPDGKQIAYDWQTSNDPTPNIYVKTIGAETELRITTSDADVNPAWSPDSRWIAFYRAVPGRPGYYVVSPLGGPVRLVLPVTGVWALNQSYPGNSWFPDSRHLAAVVPSGVVSVDIETGEQRQLTVAEGQLVDTFPSVSPDGRTLAFIRYAATDTADIHLCPSSGGPARRLTGYGTDFWGHTWTPNGREIVFSATRNGVSGLWRIAVNGGEPSPIFSSVAGTLLHPAVTRQGDRLAYAVGLDRTSLWRTDISGSSPLTASAPVRLIGSGRLDNAARYSPDGNKIAFHSTRSGPLEVWECDKDGKNPVQLTHVGGPNNGTPRWSPDGSQVAFDSRVTGDAEIMVVAEETRNARRITNNAAEDVVPSWSADGKWIYFASNRKGDFQIYRLRSGEIESPSNPAVPVTRRGGFNAMESPDGTYLYYARGRDKIGGLWRRRLDSLSDEGEELILESLHGWGWCALGPNGVFFLEEGPEHPSKVHLKFLDLYSRRVTDLRALDFPVSSVVSALTVSPDGRHVVFDQIENSGSSIVIIEKFR
jgi:Tol biopolymer transport system component